MNFEHGQSNARRMRFYFYLLIFLAISNDAISQDTTQQIIGCAENEICHFPEIDPEFPGGHVSLSKYISQNTIYPKSAIDLNEQGTVYVKFIVDTEGTVINITIEKSVSPLLDQEAIRVVSAMPKWEPAVQAGKKVCAYYTLPITYFIR